MCTQFQTTEYIVGNIQRQVFQKYFRARVGIFLPSVLLFPFPYPSCPMLPSLLCTHVNDSEEPLLSPSYKLTRVTPSEQSYRPLYPLNMYFQACTDMENSARTSLVQDLQPRGTMCLRYGQKSSKRIHKWYVIRETSLDNVVQYRNGVQNAIIQRMGLGNRSNQGEGR